MRKRVKSYLDYIDKILAHELPVTASFDASGEYVEKAAKDMGKNFKIVDFVRFEKGEGIEKRVDDFAAEVASMIK